MPPSVRRLAHRLSLPWLLGLASTACSEPAPSPMVSVSPAAPAEPAGCDDASHRADGSSCAMPALQGPAVKGDHGLGQLDAHTGAPQLIEFEAAYCSACATMAPVVSSIVRSCAKASEVVRRVDVGKEEGEALARHYGVGALPTFIAVDSEGQEVFRKVGVQAPAELASLVSEVSGENCSARN